MPNKLSQFWQELKRRKVLKVIAMYAGGAFVLFDLANNVVVPLNLPDWTPRLVIIIALVGFPIMVVLSWIFDITPEGLKKTESIDELKEQETPPSPVKRRLRVSDVIIGVLFAAVIILLYPKIFKADKLEFLRMKGEISVAVMPFQNMSGDESKDFWQEMIQDNLISSLSNAKPLKVRQTESINTLLEHSDIANFSSLTPSKASQVSQKLETNVFIYGSIIQVGENIRLNGQLIDSETEEVFKSFRHDGQAEDILYGADSLSLLIRDYLLISVLGKEVPPDVQPYIGNTKSPEALKCVMDGFKAFYKYNYSEAVDLYKQALKHDTSYYAVYALIAYNYGNQGLVEDAKKWTLKAYNIRNKLSPKDKLIAEDVYSAYFGTIQDRIRVVRQILELNDQDAGHHYLLGALYINIDQNDKAIKEFEKSLEIYDKWEIKPGIVWFYTELGLAYHEDGLYRKEQKLYRRAEKDYPGDPLLLSRQAILALSRGRMNVADKYIEEYKSVYKEKGISDATLAYLLGDVYYQSHLLDKAEEYFRKSIKLEPGEPEWLNTLAYLLINHERNIAEGIELVDKALELSPDNYQYLDTKGWGLYKQGNYQEALEILERSWELKPMYDHNIFLHLEEAKSTVGLKIGLR
jgi:tetratricopeptide (TPR) repeat protein